MMSHKLRVLQAFNKSSGFSVHHVILVVTDHPWSGLVYN